MSAGAAPMSHGRFDRMQDRPSGPRQHQSKRLPSGCEVGAPSAAIDNRLVSGALRAAECLVMGQTSQGEASSVAG